MGTDKRERQKANRQLRLEQMARDARKRKTKRRGLQIGLGIPLAVALVFGLVWLFQDDTSTTPPVADASSTTVDPTSITTPLVTVIGTPPETNVDGAYPCPEADGTSPRIISFPVTPPTCIDPEKTYSALVQTNLGTYTVDLDVKTAPIAVNSFVYLARYHYFDQTPCHRVVPDFVVQCGDPTGTGSGGPGYALTDELDPTPVYKTGSLAMANSGPDSSGSQFFVVSADSGAETLNRAGTYTLFGSVSEGMGTIDAANSLAVGDGAPSSPVTILSVAITEA